MSSSNSINLYYRNGKLILTQRLNSEMLYNVTHQVLLSSLTQVLVHLLLGISECIIRF